MSNNQQQQQQQHAWQNYYAYQQQYYAQQAPAYPFAPHTPLYQQQTTSTSPFPPQYQSSDSNPYQQSLPPTKRPRTQDEYFCDSCELTLESQVAYSAHVKSHTTCTECSFAASPKLVKAHHSSVHGKFKGNGFKTVTVAIPGCKVQRYRICVGNHPDDVKKWIADRRKNFPRRSGSIPVEGGQTTVESHFGGLLDGYGSSSSEGEPPSKVLEEPKGIELTQKLNDETTIGKSHDSTSNNCITGASVNSNNDKFRTQMCRYFARTGTCRNGDKCTFQHERFSRNNNNSPQSNLTSTTPQMGKKKAGKSSTLLKKLLKSDTDREMTLTLQLLRYIVDCNFLQEQRDAKKNA